MKVIRTEARLIRETKEDEAYVKASPAERVAFMWELTAEIWSLRGSEYVERRLPRNVTNLTRK